MGVMNEPIDEGGGQSVVSEHVIPAPKFQIRSHDDTLVLIGVGDETRE